MSDNRLTPERDAELDQIRILMDSLGDDESIEILNRKAVAYIGMLLAEVDRLLDVVKRTVFEKIILERDFVAARERIAELEWFKANHLGGDPMELVKQFPPKADGVIRPEPTTWKVTDPVWPNADPANADE